MRRFNFIFPLVCCLLLATVRGRAQHYYFKHFQAEDGLANNTVLALLQDRQGFIWMGTKGGLNWFDGYTFKTVKNPQNKLGIIGNNIILSLAADQKGGIWIGTGNGVFRYDTRTEQLRELPTHFTGNAHHLVTDNNDQLWFLGGRTLYCYNQVTKQLNSRPVQASCMALDKDQQLWLGNRGRVIRYDPVKNATNTYQVLDSALITAILPVSKEEILVGTSKHGLKYYHTRTGISKQLLLRNADSTDIYIRDIIAAGKDEYWVATESGIYICNLRTGNNRQLQKRTGDPFSLSDNAVYALCKDQHGDIWAGTYFGGVNYFSHENARFEKYYPVIGANSISGNAVREICTDEDPRFLWIGTEDAGINRFDIKAQQFRHDFEKQWPVAYTNIHGLLAVRNKLYAGPFEHGFEVIDATTGNLVRKFKLVGDGEGPQSDFVMCIYRTRNESLLIGTIGAGLFTYNEKNAAFTRVLNVPANTDVNAILEDHTGRIWIGGKENGAFYYDPVTSDSGYIRFTDPRKDPAGNNARIQGIFEDSCHALWFAAEGQGLIYLDATRKVIRKYTTENGLPSNYIFKILEDDEHRLWISTLKGLVCMDPATAHFTTYTRSNGLITDQFNYNSAWKTPDGKMYFGTVKGMIAFNPLQFGTGQPPPFVYFTGLQIHNQEVTPGTKGSPLTRSIPFTDSIRLKHNQSAFSIEFAALNFSAPEATRYRYRLQGLDKDWTSLHDNRRVFFTELPAGKYTFILQAESSTGDWKTVEKRLYIRIDPPFWKSYPALFLYFLLFLISLLTGIQLYKRSLERKNQRKLQLYELEKQKEMYASKLSFFTNIAHEIQTPLTLIIGPLEWAIKKAEEQPAIRKHLVMVSKNAARLQALITELLDFRKTESGQFALTLVNTDFVALISDTAVLFKTTAEKKDLALEIVTPSQPCWMGADPEACIRIFSNLLSNAIKYGSYIARVEVLADPGKAILAIRVSNNGTPIPEALREKIFEPFYRVPENDQPGTGIGLALARSLAILHGGSLNLIENGPEQVIFEWVLPWRHKPETGN